ncbi:MAG: hypothetical protein ACRDK4_03570 [Solirubrobacteraceae bacterium]
MSSESALATARRPLESALYLEAGAETVFALYTAPASSPASVGVVLAHSGANNFSAHRNGVWTSISRRLAREGIPSLRFDFAGTGESSGEFVLGPGGQPVIDAVAAMDALRAAGCRRLLVVGSCFGAIPSIVAAASRADVAALILLSPPLVLPDGSRMGSMRDRVGELVNLPTLRAIATNGDYRRWFFARLLSLLRIRASVKARGLLKCAPATPAAALSSFADASRGLLMERELARLVTSGRSVEIVYGTADGNLAQVMGDADASRAIALLRRRDPALLEWTVLEGPVHGLEDATVQEKLAQLVLERACDLIGPPGPLPSPV